MISIAGTIGRSSRGNNVIARASTILVPASRKTVYVRMSRRILAE